LLAIDERNMKKNNTNPFGKEKEIKEVLRKLTNPNYQGSNLALPEDATIIEKFKYEICQSIAHYKLKNKLELKEMADLLSLDKSSMSKLLRCHIELFALDSLITYAEKLTIPLQITETPRSPRKRILPSSNSRKSSRNILLAKK